MFFVLTFFGAFFLNDFFLSEIDINSGFFDNHTDLFGEKKSSLLEGPFSKFLT